MLSDSQEEIITSAITDLILKWFKGAKITPEVVRNAWVQAVDQVLAEKFKGPTFSRLSAEQQDELTQGTILSLEQFKEMLECFGLIAVTIPGGSETDCN